MKSLEISHYGVAMLEDDEILETEGGIIPLLIIGAILLVGGCTSQVNKNNSSYQVNVQCSNCSVTVNQSDSSVTVKPAR
ncbi:MAG TPA: hypothetical protein PLQ32_05520 [Flavihumibacter sp.]|nr:hypothetical protein [Flavihumibacter sp.]